LKTQCSGIKRDGGRCTAVVTAPNSYCYHHSPGTAEKRRRNASRGGKSKPSKDIHAVRAQLQMLADGVLAGSVDRADAGTVGQLLNIVLRSIELDRRLRETEDLEQRLSELEEALEQNNQNSGGGRAWG
jgi:hypothetical protein